MTARVLRRVGEALRGQQRYAEAELPLTRSLELFVGLGRTADEVELCAALGVLYAVWHRPELSLALYERAERLLTPPEQSSHGWVQSGLASAYQRAGRVEEAQALRGRAIGIAQRLGDDYLLDYIVQYQAWRAVEAGDLDEAEGQVRRMVAIFERIRVAGAVGGAIEGLAAVADKRGRTLEAMAELDAAVDLYDRLGDRIRGSQIRWRRAELLDRLGRPAVAAQDRQAADLLARESTVDSG